MSKRKHDPVMPKVIQAEVSEKHFSLRVVLLAMSVALALVGIGYGVYHLINRDPGWSAVEYAGNEVNCSDEFTLQYHFGVSGMQGTAEARELSLLYSDLMEEAYVVFHPELESAQIHNLAYLNAHPNEPVPVHPRLHRALAQIRDAENRNIYLAPVYVEYNRMFVTEQAGEAARYDPRQNEEQRAYVAHLAKFANDPAQIDLEILPDDRVILHVSEEYLEFAEAYELDGFLDFGWMKNAFIVDWGAELLQEKGLTKGYLSSYDGFTRNLDRSGEVFTQNVFDRLGDEIYLPARLQYQGPMALINLRNYPLSELDRWHYYSFGDSISSVYVDPADGLSKSGTDNLLAYEAEGSCADLVLRLAPLYLTEELDERALLATGISCIWAEGGKLLYSDEAAILSPNPDTTELYHLEYRN